MYLHHIIYAFVCWLMVFCTFWLLLCELVYTFWLSPCFHMFWVFTWKGNGWSPGNSLFLFLFCFYFWETTTLLYSCCIILYALQLVWGSNFFTALAANTCCFLCFCFCCCCCLHSRRPNGCEVLSRFGFDVHYPSD